MKLSTKGRYGVKAMFELSLNYGEGPIPLNCIADKQNLSVHYLEQLFSNLRKAGLVKSIRGAQGGYMLGRNPADITVGDIIRTLEGPLAPADCVIGDDTKECYKADGCVTRIVWEKIRDSINDVVDGITLQDMIDDYKKMNNKDSYMYYI
ncbi:RrF2 family transcriptional regulator [Marinisporobacter balticus]|uniref:BadM/Rrf2 family transcriptional regulator n=1 Tax=Marinisporobacter balticus TaxID=2018667 RepID=A0A4R2LIC0_9FIRM|nr:Rrf2 family transcriptional regulator [Marinisporobacter balticus]TCO79065.1 BadM/Rrf2 family transcriptional regulator [Marinisporobacter balticus]